MQSEVENLGAISAPNTDQLNVDDLISGPRVFTVTKITRGKGTGTGKGDQPVNIHLAEHPYPWRPCKTVRRLLMDAWGPKPGEWPEGAQIELYRDTEVRFGGDIVGGIRVRAMSHLPNATIEHLATATRGQRVKWTIRRLEKRTATKPAPDVQASLDTAVRLFGEIGVTLDELEMQIGSDRPRWGAAELAQLRADYSTRRKAGASTIEPTPREEAPMSALDKLAAIADELGKPLAAFMGERFGCVKPPVAYSEEELSGYLATLNGGAK